MYKVVYHKLTFFVLLTLETFVMNVHVQNCIAVYHKLTFFNNLPSFSDNEKSALSFLFCFVMNGFSMHFLRAASSPVD